RLLADLYDPTSAQYHQFLTTEQFTQLFGPTQQEYDAVAAFAQANGLTVTARHANRMLLDVRGSVENIEQALHVALRVYPHPNEARTFFAPNTEPTVELAVPLLHISGLTDFDLPRPASLHLM